MPNSSLCTPLITFLITVSTFNLSREFLMKIIPNYIKNQFIFIQSEGKFDTLLNKIILNSYENER